MRKSAPQPIEQVLKNVVEELNRTKKKGTGRLLAAWPSVSGKEFSRHTKPAAFKNGTLWVNVDDSAWLYQANLQREELLAKLNKRIGTEKIRQLLFRIGEIRK